MAQKQYSWHSWSYYTDARGRKAKDLNAAIHMYSSKIHLIEGNGFNIPFRAVCGASIPQRNLASYSHSDEYCAKCENFAFKNTSWDGTRFEHLTKESI